MRPFFFVSFVSFVSFVVKKIDKSCSTEGHAADPKYVSFVKFAIPTDQLNSTQLNSDGSGSPKSPKVGLGLMLVAVVGAMISLQLIQKRVPSIAASKRPGPARGDLTLTADCLGTEYHEWTRKTFTPAPAPETLSEGTVAWTHSWTFERENQTALVAFDQADFAHWHDLTVCYKGIGWTLAEKSTVSPNAPVTAPAHPTDNHASTKWPYVVARLSKPGNVGALLVFSLFFDDGDPVDAGDYDTSKSAARGIRQMFADRLRNDRRTSTVASLRQCQVFMPHSGDLTDEQFEHAIALHLGTREAFRGRWLEHWHKSKDE